MKINLDDKEEELKTRLMETILEYMEGRRTFRSVLAFGITAYSRSKPSKNPDIAEIVLQLNAMGNQIADGKIFSKEDVKEIFTNMLESLIKD